MIDKVKYAKIMKELQTLWEQNEGLLMGERYKERGIRSSQVAALVALLIEKGVFSKKSE